MKQTKNLFNKLKFYFTGVQAKKQLQCKKNDFCNCKQDLTDMCVPCVDQNRGRFVFCPGSDPVQPCDLKVESTFPVDLSTGASIKARPVVVFSQDIDPLLANEMSVRDGTNEVEGTRAIIDDNTFVFTPDAYFDNDTEYEVRYSAGVSRDCFVDGAFKFTTQSLVFKMSSQTPTYDATGFPINGSVQVTFNMDLLPAGANNITILDDMSANVMGTTSIINGMPNTMAFNTTMGPYICGKTYTGTFTAASIDGLQTTSGIIRFTTEDC